MESSSLNEQINSLFKDGESGIYTYAAGYSHAKYDQYTEMSQHIHGQMLGILESIGAEYFLFAGSMVGYVRNKAMPDWMDDLDVIILEDNIQLFEETAVPALKECGFNCFFQERFTGGGYHLLGMQQGGDRRLSIPLTDEKQVSVPWAQIDAFYTTVDEGGFLRNPAAWGLYHTKDVPVGWVRPGRFVEFGDMRVRVFSDYEADIQKEYGDVLNNIVIHSHDATYLNAPGVAWSVFETAFREHLAATSSSTPPGLDAGALARYQPGSGAYETSSGESFASICAGVLAASAGEVRLTDGEQLFWTMDLKRLFPGLTIRGFAQTPLQAHRAAHLRAFIDNLECADAGIKSTYDACVAGLHRFLGA